MLRGYAIETKKCLTGKKRKGAANSVPFVPKSMISPRGQQFTPAFASTPRGEESSTPRESIALGNANDLLLNLSNDGPPPMRPITNSLHDISVPSFSTYVSNGLGSSMSRDKRPILTQKGM